MYNERVKQFLPAVATLSLGDAELHSLELKLGAAAEKGFLGIELYWPDLLEFAWQHRFRVERVGGTKFGHMMLEEMLQDPTRAAIIRGAVEVGRICDTLGLQVVCLQPFRDFDSLFDSDMRELRFREFGLWMDVASAVSTEMIGVTSTVPPATTAMGYTDNRHIIVRNMQELAYLAKGRGLQILYENLCFAQYIRTWKQALNIVALAREDNLKFLPNVFNICGANVMSPEAFDCLNPEEEWRLDDLYDMQGWIRNHMGAMPLLQVSDAERPPIPLSPNHPWRCGGQVSGLMAQSRNARCFPFEGGYLPVVPVIRRLEAIGWHGWVSMEAFSVSTSEQRHDTVDMHADRAWTSWQLLAELLGWPVEPTYVDSSSSGGEGHNGGYNQ